MEMPLMQPKSDGCLAFRGCELAGLLQILAPIYAALFISPSAILISSGVSS
jgi:hypothetical protein